ncbi:SGNH/GDSL hydrolase family protein [Telluribacter sp.]|jgi:hypothetical protein|uniref:SGNH/GDSL hydrolase family protein n=1 Tax=Telluribacter sp. TaxID=1978767 RepID=UPI002E0F6D22|nr:SGNH/GDSL hydrolase family protein [Telluribacter sp.]
MPKRALFWIILVIINLCIIEVSLRVFNFFYPSSVFHDDSYNQYRGKPHSDNYGFPLNSKGFKDIEYNLKKDGTFRIVGIGDSFTFGVVPYSYNYLKILEDSLNGRIKKPAIEIVNMGIASTSPPDYLAVLANEALPMQPDMAIVSVFVGNDIVESTLSSRKRKMYSYFYLASALYYIYKFTSSIGKGTSFSTYGEGASYCDTCSTYKPEKYLGIESERCYIFRKDDLRFKRDIVDALYYLKRISFFCKAKGIKLLVVLLPDEMQVNEKLRKEVMDNMVMGPEIWDNSQPNRVLHQKLSEMKIPVIDLLPTFIANSKDTPTYIPNDSHWNIKGHEVAAATLLKVLPQYITN